MLFEQLQSLIFTSTPELTKTIIKIPFVLGREKSVITLRIHEDSPNRRIAPEIFYTILESRNQGSQVERFFQEITTLQKAAEKGLVRKIRR